jgi:beta-glucanase (GH16 family)
MVAAMVLALVSQGVPTSEPGGYKLVWNDEFDHDGRPDPTKWSFERGFIRNKEPQWYQPANATISKGLLTIEGRREQVRNPIYDAGNSDWRRNREFAEYTSSALETRNLHSWLYGRFESRARFNAGSGMWPAIWFLGVKGKWPLNGEIDLMEFYRSTLLANTVFGHNQWNSVKTPISDSLAKDPKWTSKFHIWRMDWDADFIKLYVDDQLLNTTDLSKTIDPDGTNPFHQPVFILLNLAIGATGGDPSTTKFPVKFEVDYVRVYQKSQAF